VSPIAGPEAPAEGLDSLHRLEHEITVLIRRTVESVWAGGYGAHEAVDRYTYPVLAALDENGDQSLTVLTGRLGVSKPTASRQVSRLSRAGLVAVRPDTRDSRSVVVSLTPEGLTQHNKPSLTTCLELLTLSACLRRCARPHTAQHICFSGP